MNLESPCSIEPSFTAIDFAPVISCFLFCNWVEVANDRVFVWINVVHSMLLSCTRIDVHLLVERNVRLSIFTRGVFTLVNDLLSGWVYIYIIITKAIILWDEMVIRGDWSQAFFSYLVRLHWAWFILAVKVPWFWQNGCWKLYRSLHQADWIFHYCLCLDSHFIILLFSVDLWNVSLSQVFNLLRVSKAWPGSVNFRLLFSWKIACCLWVGFVEHLSSRLYNFFMGSGCNWIFTK